MKDFNLASTSTFVVTGNSHGRGGVGRGRAVLVTARYAGSLRGRDLEEIKVRESPKTMW